MKKFITHSREETYKLGQSLAKKLNGVIALTGELGSGKTTFVQGFARGLGIKDKIISPTFVLIREHPVLNSKTKLYHIDLYRLDNEKHIRHSGIEEILNNPEDITLIEWAEKAKNLLPKGTKWVTFKSINENTREIILD